MLFAILGSISILALFLLNPYCRTQSIDLGQENIEGVQLLDSVNKGNVQTIYGDEFRMSKRNSYYKYFIKEDDYIVTNVNNNSQIVKFIVYSTNIVTDRGIKVGDTENEMINAYGNKYYTRKDRGKPIVGYVDLKNNCYMEFWFDKFKNITSFTLNELSLNYF